MRRVSHQPRYEDVVLRTKPVFYIPLQGVHGRELVRQVAPGTDTATTVTSGPFTGASARRFTASTADDDRLVYTTDTSYHPGNTMSIGGWINRLGAGDTVSSTGPVCLHMGTGDVVLYFPTGTNAGRLVFRKAGTGDMFATSATDWGSPYTKGWQHVIFTKAGSTRGLFVNGVADAGGGTTADQTIVAAATDIRVGISVDSATSDFDGAMAHWAIWNRAITSAEAAELYRAGRNAT